MTKSVPLEALLRRMPRMAEQAFDRDGEIDPMWLIEIANGEQRTFVSPMGALRCGCADRQSFCTHPQKPFINQATCDE